MVIRLRRIQIMSFGNNNHNNNNKHDDIHHTDIGQSKCHIGLGETFTPNPMHTVHLYVDWLAFKNQNISILSL
jgi:hypothetical protein